MNLKTGLMALTMATSSMAGHAQTTAKTITRNDSVVRVVQKAVSNNVNKAGQASFIEARKALNSASRAPKGMVKVTKETGTFVGKITPEGLNGEVAYATTSKMIRDPRLAPQTKVTYGLGYLNAENVHNAGTATAVVEKGNTNVRGDMFLGKLRDDVRGGLKLRAGHDYKLGSGFSAGPEVGLHTMMQKVNNDLKGRFAPEVMGVGKFKHEFDNGVRVGGQVGVGAAARLGYNNRSTHVGSIVETYKAGASVGYKGVDVVAEAGKDVHLGKNASAGVRFTF